MQYNKISTFSFRPFPSWIASRNNFEDLKAGLAFLKRKVDGENETQLSFIKANVNSIVIQLVSSEKITFFVQSQVLVCFPKVTTNYRKVWVEKSNRFVERSKIKKSKITNLSNCLSKTSVENNLLMVFA
jgi:hypothetical protein